MSQQQPGIEYLKIDYPTTLSVMAAPEVQNVEDYFEDNGRRSFPSGISTKTIKRPYGYIVETPDAFLYMGDERAETVFPGFNWQNFDL